MATLAQARKIALALPDVTEKPSYGTPAFYAKKKIFMRFLPNDVDVVIRMSISVRDMLVKAAPKKFEITDHYKKYDAIVIHVKHVNVAELTTLIKGAHASTLAERVASRAARKQRRKTP